MAENIFEEVSLLNCSLWSLPNQHSKNKKIWVIWALKKYFTGASENTFPYGRHIPKTCMIENIFEKVSLLNCDSRKVVIVTTKKYECCED